MILQIINVIFGALIFLQVLYLFTCGQFYMQKSAKREGINFFFYKLFYIFAASLVFGNAMLSDCQTIWTSLIYASVIAIIQSRVNIAYKLFQKTNKRLKNV